MSGSLITNEKENTQSSEIDTEFLLKYFKDHDIKQISLTPERELLIEYNSGQTEISGKTNNQGLQKVLSYYQKSGQTSLSQNDLVNSNETKNPSSNKAIISTFIIGTLIVGAVIGVLARNKKKRK
jgi:hypothetical protein